MEENMNHRISTCEGDFDVMRLDNATRLAIIEAEDLFQLRLDTAKNELKLELALGFAKMQKFALGTLIGIMVATGLGSILVAELFKP
jgi:hypothetical protein